MSECHSSVELIFQMLYDLDVLFVELITRLLWVCQAKLLSAVNVLLVEPVAKMLFDVNIVEPITKVSFDLNTVEAA